MTLIHWLTVHVYLWYVWLVVSCTCTRVCVFGCMYSDEFSPPPPPPPHRKLTTLRPHVGRYWMLWSSTMSTCEVDSSSHVLVPFLQIFFKIPALSTNELNMGEYLCAYSEEEPTQASSVMKAVGVVQEKVAKQRSAIFIHTIMCWPSLYIPSCVGHLYTYPHVGVASSTSGR